MVYKFQVRLVTSNRGTGESDDNDNEDDDDNSGVVPVRLYSEGSMTTSSEDDRCDDTNAPNTTPLQIPHTLRVSLATDPMRACDDSDDRRRRLLLSFRIRTFSTR